MSFWTEFRDVIKIVGAVVIGVYTGNWAFLVTAASDVYGRDQRRKARRRANAERLASLKDRYQMVRGGTEPRRIVYGRARVSGPIVYGQSTGTKKEFLHLVVALVGHECDAVETVYFNDIALPAPDGSGFIQSGEFALSTTHTATEAWSGTSKVLANTPSAILGVTRETGSGDMTASVVLATPADYTLAGATLTIPGGGAGTVNYQYTSVTPRVRVRTFLGAASQAAASELVTESAGRWTSAHQLKGICYAYVRLEYDQQVFGQVGLPNVSAVVRGKKVLDPRTSTTYWTPNAALCTADYLKDALYGLGATTAQVPSAELITAANVSDEAVTLYSTGTVAVTNGSPNITGTGTSWLARVRPGMNFVGPNAVSMTVLSVTSNTALVLTANYAGSTLSGQAYSIREPRYTANGVLDSADAARNNLDKIVESMAGTVVWTQGRWLVRAGAHITPTITITEDWLADEAPVITPRAPRQELVNRVVATYAEREKLYTDVQAPAVTNATYVSDDGGLDLPAELTYDLCDGGVRAQRLAKIHLERTRQALTVKLSCNLRAYDLSPSDTVAVTLARYGWSAKVFEVMQRSLDLESMRVGLVLRETASGVWDWALGAETAIDLTPNTDLPSPFNPPAALTGLSVTSGTAQLLRLGDGSIITRALVSWTQSTDVYTVRGGRIEIRWKRDDATEWISAPSVPGDDTSTLIGPLDDLRINFVQVRPVNTRGRNGAWTTMAHIVVGKTAPPTDVAGLAAAAITGAIRLSWTPNTETDYAATELRLGTVWASGTRLDTGAAGSTEVVGNAYAWAWPAPGSYTVMARHRDTTGNLSNTTASLGVTVTGTDIAVGGGNLLKNSSFEVDSNADGLADEWTAYSNGTTGTITRSIVGSGIFGGNRQRIEPAGLGTGTSDAAGVYQPVNVQNLAGQPVTFSVHALMSSGGSPKMRMFVRFYSDFGTTQVGSDIDTGNTAGPYSAWERRSATGTVPSGAVWAFVYTWAAQTTSTQGVTFDIDALQFETGRAMTAYAPRADEILVGQVGTLQLAGTAATEITSDAHDFAGAAVTVGTAQTMRSFTYTPPVNCTIEFTAVIAASTVLPDSANQLWWSYEPGTSGETTIAACNSDSTARQTFPGIGSFAATGGVQLTLRLKATRASGNPAMNLYESFMRVTAIKR